MHITSRLITLFPIGLLWLIIGIGMIARIHNGDYFPIYQNDDSVFYVWLGNSILDDFRHPTSLTIFDVDNPTLFWRSQYKDFDPVNRFGFRLSDAYFDHPFLGSIIMALPARYFGFTGFTQIPHLLVRMPVLLTSLLTMGLTYAFLSRITNRATGLLSVAILAFWPTAILASRQGYLENIITPFFLLALLGVYEYSQTQQRIWFLVTVLSGIISGWIKFAGYAVVVASAYGLLLFHKYRIALWLGVAGLLSLFLYVVYGLMVGGDHFFWTIAQQQGRGAYVASIFNYVRSSKMQGEMEDGWWYIGMLGLWFAAFSRLPHRLVGMAGFWWLTTTFFLTGPDNTSPWYIYPLYPLMAGGAAIMLLSGLRYNPLPVILTLLMLGFTGFRNAGVDVSSALIRFSVVGVSLFGFGYFMLHRRWRTIIVKSLFIGLLCLSFYGNVLSVMKAKANTCGVGGCPEPEKIILEIEE
jgi:hypothetical protein